MDWTWHTIAASELAWTALCLWGVWRHLCLWRDIDHDIDLLEAGVIPASDGVMALFRNDRATEFDWVVMKAFLAFAGVSQMFAVNRDRPLASWLTVAALFGAVLWIRSRAEMRGRNRNVIKRKVEEAQP